jgi:predicted RNA polymerase sigma factor
LALLYHASAYPFVHIELHTGDRDKAKDFYGQLLDWKLEDMDMGPVKYTVINVGDAMLTTEVNAHKRTQRAKSKLRERTDLLDVPTGPELQERLNNVYTLPYLLFNEGYYSSHTDDLIRRNLCDEAVSLTTHLTEHRTGARPTSRALLASMYFHFARFDAHIDERGNPILLEDQNQNRWDGNRIAQGLWLLKQASESNEISTYHLEAAIAAQHCTARSFIDTDGSGILNLYNLLIGPKPSPVYQLNRAIVLAKVKGPAAGI